MKECNNETEIIAYIIDPYLTGNIDPPQHPSLVNESRLVEILRHNKVVKNFEKGLDIDSVLKEKYFSTFPKLRVLYDEMNQKIQKDSVAFRSIKRVFNENNIDFMLIKSDGYFPHESDNLDVLIRPQMLGEVIKLLKKAGYSELPYVRERNKYLFRNNRAPDILPLHIHTRVEWEGTQFADSASLWRRSKKSNDYDGFSIPSAEDCILITSAHLFFENHEVKLADLLKITSKLRNSNIDWDYMFNHARRLHWNSAFCLTMLSVNLVFKELSGKDMLSQQRLTEIEEMNHGYFKLLHKTMKPFSSNYVPLQVPYSVSVLFFINRVFGDSQLSLYRRFSHLKWVASNVLREKSLRTNELPFAQP